MEIYLKGQVSDIYEGDKSNSVTFTDTEKGGPVKFSLPKDVGVKLNGIYDLHITAKGAIGDKGIYVKVLSAVTVNK